MNWFSPEELTEMSRPTMDRAIEAIEANDLERAAALCAEMRSEWRGLHDTLVGMIAGLASHIQARLGEDALEDAWMDSLDRMWRTESSRVAAADRKRVVRGLAATWRAHSGSGGGANPGSFTIEEDGEKFTFKMNPCGSGQRLWRNGAYEGEHPLTKTERSHTWTFGRANFPVYCTHCAFMNDILPIRWYGVPLFPADVPDDFDADPCTWYWYKDPGDIPERFWERYKMSSYRQGRRVDPGGATP